MLPEKTENGGVRTAGAISLKGAVKSMIMAKRLSDLTKEMADEPEEDLIVPEAVETLWGIVAERDDGEMRKIEFVITLVFHLCVTDTYLILHTQSKTERFTRHSKPPRNTFHHRPHEIS